jgi:hypothetical protein
MPPTASETIESVKRGSRLRVVLEFTLSVHS